MHTIVARNCIYVEYIVSRVHLGAGAGVQPCAMRIGWGLVFQRVRNFYHYPF